MEDPTPAPPSGSPPRPPAAGAATETATVASTRVASTRVARRSSVKRRKRRNRVIAGALVAALAIAGIGFVLTRGDEKKVRAAPPPSTTTTATTTVPTPQAATTATTAVPELQVFDSPADGANVVNTLSQTTEYGLPRTLLVLEQHPGWLKALLPVRPNGSTGWVRETDVTLGSTPFKIEIKLFEHKLILSNAGQKVLESGIVIGKEETPTPLGMYYITDPVDLQDRPNGAYGAFALGISGFSEVLMEFNGGPGQLAVHGTSRPDQVGQNISNGCVRVPNDVILQIAQQAPLGTPVEIVA